MQLRPYQVDGALWLAETPRGVLADPPGVGKTPQTIRAADAVGARNCYVIAPAVATGNWKAEWARWSRKATLAGCFSYERVVNDEALQRRIRQDCDVLVIDEAHYLKGLSSKRTEVVYNWKRPLKGLAAGPAYVWALTGTPAPNHLGEWYTHIRTLRPDLIEWGGQPMPYMEFLRRYTKWRAGAYAIQVLGVNPSTRAEFQGMVNQLAFRRELESVLPDLPPITWGTISVERERVSGELRRLEQDPAVRSIIEEFEQTGAFNAPDVHLATLRRLIGEAKAAGTIELVKDELHNGHYQKVVLWAMHTSVIRQVERAFRGAVLTIDGSTPQAARAEIVDRFQTDPEIRVFVAQLRAAGTAITLTAAHNTVFLESSWVPDDDLQAAKRCHRYGQTRPVLARQSVLAGSVDELVMRLHQRKLSNQILPTGANQ